MHTGTSWQKSKVKINKKDDEEILGTENQNEIAVKPNRELKIRTKLQSNQMGNYKKGRMLKYE